MDIENAIYITLMMMMMMMIYHHVLSVLMVS